MPVDFRCDRGDYARVLISLIAREATGASSARHSLRPLLSRAEKNSRKPRAPRAAGSRSRTRRHCEERLVRRSSTSEGGSDEAIHSSISRQHGLLHGACHRARIRATRWLAMTVSNPLCLGGLKIESGSNLWATNTPHSRESSPGLTGRPSIPETLVMKSRSRSVRDTPLARSMTIFCEATCRIYSQLPRIGERKRRHPPGVFVEDQGPGDRRLGALAAVFALAEPAVDADRRALGLLEIDPRGVDQAGRMADFTPQADGKARLRLRMRRHRPAHHLRDREIPGAVGQVDHVAQQSVGRVQGRMQLPQRAGAAELRKREGAGRK